MDKPDIKLIKDSLPNISERIAKGTIEHLVEYIEYLEQSRAQQKDSANNDTGPDNESYGTCGFCRNDGPITKDPDGLMCDRCWDKD